MIGEPLLVTEDTVKQLAEEEGCTPAQLLLGWVNKRGASTIPKVGIALRLAQCVLTLSPFLQSVTDKRIAENFKSVEISQKAYDKLCEFGQSKPARFSESSSAAACIMLSEVAFNSQTLPSLPTTPFGQSAYSTHQLRRPATQLTRSS